MKNTFRFAVEVSLLLVLGGCGGGSTSLFTPNVAGDWEISAVSTSGTNTDLIQVRLTQADHDATGSGAVFYGEQSDTVHLGGLCAGDGHNMVGVTVANDGSLKFSLNEGGNTFAGTGKYTGGIMSGTYAETPGSNCPDSGKWTANSVPVLKASFSGSLPGEPNALFQMQITENAANHGVTATGNVSGDISVGFSLTGSYVGNAISGQLTINVPNQPPIVEPINIYYSPSSKAIYVFQDDGTFEGKFAQD